jgi:hypothetical protein
MIVNIEKVIGYLVYIFMHRDHLIDAIKYGYIIKGGSIGSIDPCISLVNLGRKHFNHQ